MLLRSGNLNPLFQSIGMNSRIANKNEQPIARELYVFIKPQLNLVAYNATIQGGILKKDKGRVVFLPNKIVLSNDVGIMYAKRRLSLDFKVVFRTKELKAQQKPHEYGSLGIYYRF